MEDLYYVSPPRKLSALASLLLCSWLPWIETLSAQNQPEWVPARVSVLPDQRSGHAVAYDAARQRLVLFGGSRSGGSLSSLSDTWEWDGSDWILLLPNNRPPARAEHALAYDVARQRVVLFGGRSHPNELGDTWEWDGNDWTPRTPANRPTARSAHAMAYDSTRQRVVLFGGKSATGEAADTWEWDGIDWTRLLPSIGPSARSGHAMAYDITRQRTVLFGGGQGLTSEFSDTWEWDGNGWALRSSSTRPPARLDHAMAYDATRQRVVLLGGKTWVTHPLFGNGYVPLSDTWEWNGNNWIPQQPTTLPTPRSSHAMAYHAVLQRVVMWGGEGQPSSPPSSFTTTWQWDGSNWIEQVANARPSSGVGHVMAYDAARRLVVLFKERGGATGQSPETWEWDGLDWNLRNPTNSPTARLRTCMAYDLARGVTVLFEGAGGLVPPLAATWEWNGSDWNLRTPGQSPTPRWGHAMAYDVARQRVVLFGGWNGFSAFAETWEWDGSNWHLRVPSNRPVGRSGHAMAYDLTRHRVVMFGGGAVSGHLSDTVEWDGTDWSLRSPSVSPAGRSAHAMAFDASRQRVVLNGGSIAGTPTSTILGDTWEWDGNVWVQMVTVNRPAPSVEHAMVYDIGREHVVLFGGTLQGDTWLYTPRPAMVETIGTPCSGGGPPPTLRSRIPYTGNPSFALELATNLPGSICVFGLSAGTQVRSVPPCTFYLRDPVIPMITLTNGNGLAQSISFPIPNSTSLRGLHLHAQAVVADPQGPVGGVSFSAGLRVTIGD